MVRPEPFSRGACRVVIEGWTSLFALVGCGDVLGFEHGAIVQCLRTSDCDVGQVCDRNACVSPCTELACEGGLGCEIAPCGEIAEAGTNVEAGSAVAACQVPCVPPNLCLGGGRQQAEPAPPGGLDDMPYGIQPSNIACIKLNIDICEWISGVGVDFEYPVGVSTFRFGVYQDIGGYPHKILGQTDVVSPNGETVQAALLKAVYLSCDDAGDSTPIWLCSATTAAGYTLAGESSPQTEVVQLFELQDDIDQWVADGLPDKWPAPTTDYQPSPAPTPHIYPLVVQH